MHNLSRRNRRLRKSSAMRDMLTSNQLTASDLISPYFIVPGKDIQKAVASMPGVYQWSTDALLQQVAGDVSLGIKAVMLFGVPHDDDKCSHGHHAHHENGLVQDTTRQLKSAFGDDLVVMTDTCLCEYTEHGHCGPLNSDNTDVDNDAAVEQLVRIALSQAEAGADMLCPSDMMDGRIGAIRQALDAQGFQDVALMAYAVKYASKFYGPFRDAAGSAPQFGDRRSYQMDARRDAREALLEAEQDTQEGADILMIKPAMACLDIIHQVRQNSLLPLAAYHVSGEYTMIKAAALNNWIQEDALVLESLNAIKRAGADMIVTYFASDMARWLK